MRITYAYQGKELAFNRETTQVVIGRPQEGVPLDLDLTPDQEVSRPPARLWVAEGHYRIEDLHSLRGTQVNGEDITGRGQHRLHAGDTIRIGDTTLQVDIPTARVDPDATQLPDEALVEPAGEIAATVDASIPAFAPADTMTQTMRRLALLYDLPLQFAAVTHLDALLQTIVERLVDVIPGAARGALLLTDRTTGQLLLKAHLPPGNPAVSLTSARRAMERQEGFIWRREEADLSTSHLEHRIASAMYAPLLWQGEALGVVCVDHCEAGTPFDTDDL